MTRGRSLTLVGLVVSLTALGIGGCGGGAGGSHASTSEGSPTISVANTGLGDVLIDSQNRTVYLFKKDTGAKSTCFGACAHNWPPVRVTGKPTVGGGAKASLIGTTQRS